MPVTVVVGGQYGSEGKGKVCAHLALTGRSDVMVRCGGPNSGHTVDLGDRKFEMKQVPCGFINPSTRLLIAAGGLISPELLLHEIEICGLTPDRLGIDRNAGIIEEIDRKQEVASGMRERFGSTRMGVGAAVSRRVSREPGFRLAADIPELRPYLTSVSDEVGHAISLGQQVVIEGTQGFGLSLYHTERWPYCTSRDTTAQSFLGEVGVGARDAHVIMAIRTFPIRVAGNSGPLPNEISWEELQQRSGYPHEIAEFTTTTKRLRRVAEFEWGVISRAVRANSPTMLALHGVDYISHHNKATTSFEALTASTQTFVRRLESQAGVPVIFIGTGPLQSEIIDVGLATDSIAHALHG